MTIGFDFSRGIIKEKTGVEWYAYQLIKGLKEIDKVNNYKLYIPKNNFDNDLNLPKNFCYRPLKWPSKRFWTLGRLTLEMFFHQPDILFIPSHTLPLILGKKNIITWHDLAYEYYPQYFSANQLRSLKFASRRLRLADLILTISEFTKSEIIKFYQIPSEKIKVTYLGIDENIYDPTKIISVDLKKYNITKPYLLYIGRIEEKKNLKILIKSFALLKNHYRIDWQLVLIGALGYQGEEIIRQINNSDNRNDIIILKWLAETEKLKLLKQAEILVLPSFYEGFGLPLIEAMALMVPIVASNLEVFKEIANDSIVYFDPHSYQDLAVKIVKLINDFNLQKLNVAKGRKLVKNYSWKKCSEKTLEAINLLNIDKR